MISAKYFAKRFVQTVLLLAFVLTFLFVFFRSLPGSYADIMVAQGAPPEFQAQFEEEWGLNDPLYVQYIRYMINFVQLNAGTSFQANMPVWDYVRPRILHSAILIAPAITTSFIIGSIYGSIAGTKRDSKFEEYGIVPIIVFGAFPSFFTSIFLIFIFAGVLDLFPTSGMFSTASRQELAGGTWWAPYLTTDFLWHYSLPFTAIVLRYTYLPSLVMRTSTVEVSDQAFTLYHKITGLSKPSRLYHTAKHASLPIITLYPLSMARSIGGLVLIEVVFGWPGIGNLLVQSVFARDYPTVQFVFFLMAAFVVIANFVVDIIYGIVDPRVQVGD